MAFNSILREKNVRNNTSRRMYGAMLKSVTTYGAEAWGFTKRNRTKVLATEMELLRRSLTKTRTDRVRNEVMRMFMVNGS